MRPPRLGRQRKRTSKISAGVVATTRSSSPIRFTRESNVFLPVCPSPRRISFGASGLFSSDERVTIDRKLVRAADGRNLAICFESLSYEDRVYVTRGAGGCRPLSRTRDLAPSIGPCHHPFNFLSSYRFKSDVSYVRYNVYIYSSL